MSEKKDPKVGDSCPVCTRPVPEVALKNNDPFCSAPCCRTWWGVEPTIKEVPKNGTTKLRQAA